MGTFWEISGGTCNECLCVLKKWSWQEIKTSIVKDRLFPEELSSSGNRNFQPERLSIVQNQLPICRENLGFTVRSKFIEGVMPILGIETGPCSPEEDSIGSPASPILECPT